MLDNYFGFLKVSDEFSVMETLIDHTRVDKAELLLLQSMIISFVEGKPEAIESFYKDIRTKCTESRDTFKQTANLIVSASFDQQKQYDLLRLYQRIGSISNLIIATAKRILILKRIEGKFCEDCKDKTLDFITEVVELHDLFKKALVQYIENKKSVFSIIEQIQEKENFINHIRSDILESLYRMANDGQLRIGDLRASENFIEHLEDTADAIEEASTSLEWLLIY